MNNDTQRIQSKRRLIEVSRKGEGSPCKLEKGAEGAGKKTQGRFWAKVKITPNCWLWLAAKDENGYGFLWSDGAMRRAHRLSWIIHNGPIPDGLWVLHNCPSGDNPACVNPAHLWLGTATDNNHDRDRKGRFHVLRGSEHGMTGGKYAVRGEKQHLAKLTAKQVIAARREFSSGRSTKTAIAAALNVSDVCICKVISRKTWTHI